MATQRRNRKYISIGHTCKTIAGSVALIVWLFLFFASAIPVKASIVSLTAKTVFSGKTHSCNLPGDASQPIPLPEDPETYTAELEDQADDDKKICSDTFSIQLVALQQLIQVQSFHFNQAIQQCIAIPLFVLHHSWKSYLI